MSDVRVIGINSAFFELIGELPAASILHYVHVSWVGYSSTYKQSAPPLQRRTEPQLTQALAGYLRQKHDAGEQPFPGDFFGELSEYVIDKKTGLPKCVARTDIEWRLYGVPRVITEFKILDGKSKRRDKYLYDGVMRFVSGRYSGSSTAGAMFGLLRRAAARDPAVILGELRKKQCLRCTAIKNDSELLPGIATFDSLHDRDAPHVTPFQLAHLFVQLP